LRGPSESRIWREEEVRTHAVSGAILGALAIASLDYYGIRYLAGSVPWWLGLIGRRF